MSKPQNTVSITNKGWLIKDHVYIQFPNCLSPLDLFTGTWEQILQTSGAFFRIVGGSALAFNGGIQTGRNISHSHTVTCSSVVGDHTHTYTTTGEYGYHNHYVGPMTLRGIIPATDNSGSYACGKPGNDTSLNRSSSQGTVSASGTLPYGVRAGEDQVFHSHSGSFSSGGSHSHAYSMSAVGSSDGFPKNYSIRIWKKTSSDRPQNTVSLTNKGWMPIGYVYIRFPGCVSPQDIYTGTWTNISSQFAGAFFRTEGALANAFDGTKQLSQNLSHNHPTKNSDNNGSHVHPIGTVGGWYGYNSNWAGGYTYHLHGGVDNITVAVLGRETDNSTSTVIGIEVVWKSSYSSYPYVQTNETYSNNGSFYHNHTGTSAGISGGGAHSHTFTLNSEGGADGYPNNYSVELYERTA